MTHSRLANLLRLVSGGAEEAGMKGWSERAADMSQKRGGNAAKMKFASGSVPTDFRGLSQRIFGSPRI